MQSTQKTNCEIQINFGSQDTILIQTTAQSAAATFSGVAPSTVCAVYNHLLTFGESLQGNVKLKVTLAGMH